MGRMQRPGQKQRHLDGHLREMGILPGKTFPANQAIVSGHGIRTHIYALVCAAILAGAGLAFAPSPAGADDVYHIQKTDKCTCRFDGRKFALGETVCIKTSSGLQMARCDTILNNTSWKFTGGSCPTARRSAPSPLKLAGYGL